MADVWLVDARGQPGPGLAWPGWLGGAGPADRSGLAESGSVWLVLPGSSQSHRQRPSGERESSVKTQRERETVRQYNWL